MQVEKQLSLRISWGACQFGFVLLSTHSVPISLTSTGISILLTRRKELSAVLQPCRRPNNFQSYPGSPSAQCKPQPLAFMPKKPTSGHSRLFLSSWSNEEQLFLLQLQECKLSCKLKLQKELTCPLRHFPKIISLRTCGLLLISLVWINIFFWRTGRHGLYCDFQLQACQGPSIMSGSSVFNSCCYCLPWSLRLL